MEDYIYVASLFFKDRNFDMIQSEPKLITKNLSLAKQWLLKQLSDGETACVHKHSYLNDKYVPSSGLLLFKRRIYQFEKKTYWEIEHIIENDDRNSMVTEGFTEVVI
jgi:hypothetical protein